MNKKEVAAIIEEIGTILELKGDNPFKIRAYYNGARAIEMLDRDLKELVDSGDISQVKGIGKALAEKIRLLVQTGSLPFYHELKESIPQGLFQMLKIPGLGAKKVKVIYEKLGISTVGELEYACHENHLRDLQGFGQKTQDKILKNIDRMKKYRSRFLYSVAEFETLKLIDFLKECSLLYKVEIAGSLRRKMETIKDIDIIGCCKAKDRIEIMQYFVDYQQTTQVISQGLTKSAITLNSGITAELRLVDNDAFPFLLQYNTGSKDHNTKLRRIAKDMNLKLNEYGLFKKDESSIHCREEKDIYIQLGLTYIPPELREGSGEIEEAQRGVEFELYNGNPLYGIFHIHSNYSDGVNTLKEIAAEARKYHWKYVGICDHSRSATYANGLSIDRVKQQHYEIEHLNDADPGFRILKGIEVDILTDGSLDYPDTVLESFDFVIASVHSQFSLSETAMTDRICRALEHPSVVMLGHPTGRLLLAREPYQVNMEKVLEIAASNNKIIEINSNPYRLDLDWRWGKQARSLKIKTAINPDAHTVEGLHDFRYGLGIARKAGFKQKDVVNSLRLEELLELFAKIKSAVK